jgi:class 3 adenylate cyclase
MGKTLVDDEKSSPLSNSRETLDRLLSEMIDFPERQPEIIQSIEDTFGQQKAVLVLDMSGFSRTTQQYGIISFLLMIHQMQLICRPSIEQLGGIVIKTDADNLFNQFENVGEAVEASREIINRLKTVNMVLPKDRHLYVAFGIGFGKILNIANEDLFGDEVNLASKLGEDIAGKGEILLTSAANAELGESQIVSREETISISGLSLTYYLIEG